MVANNAQDLPIGWGGGEGSSRNYDDVDMKDTSLYLQFTGYRRDAHDTDRLSTKPRFKNFGFVKRGDQVFTKPSVQGDQSVLVPAAEVPTRCWETVMYIEFNIIKPFEFAGESPGCSVTLKGISIGTRAGRPYFEFRVVPFKGGSLSGFINLAIACGLNKMAVDSTGDLFDPTYISQEALRSLVIPLSFDQIAIKIIEPLLLAKAEENHLVYAKTSPNNNWLQNKTVTSLEAADQARVWAEHGAWQAEQSQVSPGAASSDATSLRQQIRQLAADGKHVQVVDAIRELAPQVDVNVAGSLDRVPDDLLSQVLAKAQGGVAL